jgi:hypothetical protein
MWIDNDVRAMNSFFRTWSGKAPFGSRVSSKRFWGRKNKCQKVSKFTFCILYSWIENKVNKIDWTTLNVFSNDLPFTTFLSFPQPHGLLIKNYPFYNAINSRDAWTTLLETNYSWKNTINIYCCPYQAATQL